MPQDKFKVNATDMNSRNVAQIGTPVGLLYSKNELNVDSTHATEMLNVIYEDGLITSRKGWEQIAFLEGKINGIWHFKGYLIVHCENKLYKVWNVGKNNTFLDSRYNEIDENVVLNNARSNAFFNENEMYLLDGQTFWLISYEDNDFSISKVENNPRTYIPTTIIGKTCNGASVNNAGTPLDDINMATQWQKNKFVSGVELSLVNANSPFYDFELNNSIEPKEESDLNNFKVVITRLTEEN